MMKSHVTDDAGMIEKGQNKLVEQTSRAAIVVTGASSGIGQEIALVAAGEGLPMLLVGRSQAALDETAAAATLRGAPEAITISIDLEDRTAIAAIDQLLTSKGWHCQLLVNSAGFGAFGPAAELDASTQLNLVDVNIRALVALSLHYLPGMIARRAGGILNVGSITSYFPGPHMAAYFASKAFVRSFSIALAAEVAQHGVWVTCLSPGVVRTPFFDRCMVSGTRMMKLMPRDSASHVAQAGWRGFKTGQLIVIPRLADRLIVGAARLAPERWLAALVRILQKPR
jgi:short-subunit dehydrogenase